jgi:hypothetical protein
MENLDHTLLERKAALRARKDAEGGMTEDDLYIRGGRAAAMFCITFAFAAPCLMLWAYML